MNASTPLRTLTLALLTAMTLGGLPALAQTITAARPIQATERPVPPVIARWLDAWNRGDAQAMAALFTEDGVYQDFAFGARVEGQEGVAGWVELTVQNIPDARGRVLDAFRVGDRAAVQWVFRGTPLRMGPVEGTGRSFAVPATSVFVLQGERIREVNDYYNRAEVFRQLGLPSDGFAP